MANLPRDGEGNGGGSPGFGGIPGIRQPRAISLEQMSRIANEVQELVNAGRANSAWELIRYLHPADIASIVVSLPGTGREAMLRVMSPETVTWMLRQMNPIEAARVGTRFGARVLSPVLRQVHPSQAMATLRRISIMGRREVAESLDQESEILAHEWDSAGAMMAAQVPTVDIDGLAQAARDSLREIGEDVRHEFTYVYAVSDDDVLVGQIRLVDLALADNETPVREIVSPIVATVAVDTENEECARLRRHYDLTQLPVVDGERLIGAVLAEALLGATIEQDTLQMQEVGNVAGETVDGPLTSSVRTRLPWLTINLATTFIAAAVVALFEPTLTQVVVLAAFLPVVAGQGGIGGTQTLTLIVRAIALGELVGISARRLLMREAILGLLHGVWLGVLVAVIVIVWKQNLGLALVLGIAMLGNMMIAGLIGAAVPLVLRRVGLDPAVASAVVVTTVTDVFGFLLYLGIATAAINLIM